MSPADREEGLTLFIRERLPETAFPPFALDTVRRPGHRHRRRCVQTEAALLLPSLCPLPGSGRRQAWTQDSAPWAPPALLGTLYLRVAWWFGGSPGPSLPRVSAASGASHAHLPLEGTPPALVQAGNGLKLGSLSLEGRSHRVGWRGDSLCTHSLTRARRMWKY